MRHRDAHTSEQLDALREYIDECCLFVSMLIE
jgi:hypothetical protein